MNNTKRKTALTATHFSVIVLFIFLLLVSSCVSAPKAKRTPAGEVELDTTTSDTKALEKAAGQNEAPEVTSPVESEKSITLLFAGDVMAHRPNYQMSDYNKIWDGVRETVNKADLAFCNIEAPVCDDIPYSTYPNFNMQSTYVDAVIKAGFNVFSLCNNHTNDQGLKGIEATMKWAKSISSKIISGGGGFDTFSPKEKQVSDGENTQPPYFSGLHNKGDPFSYCLIKKDGWTILFLAVVEILNRPDYASRMNYTPYNNSGREEFIAYTKKLRHDNPCDLFVVSIHCDDAEYIEDVTQRRANYYRALLGSGVDVIWANHPHIIRERSLVSDSNGVLRKVIMYGCGNTISAQRTDPQFNKADTPRDRTGDGVMFCVTFTKKTYVANGVNNSEDKGEGIGASPLFQQRSTTVSQNDFNCVQYSFASKDSCAPYISAYKPYYITTYKSPMGYIIKPLDDTFVKELNSNGQNSWAEYIKSRIKIVGGTKESVIVE